MANIIETEAAFQAACDVVFTAAFPDVKRARRMNTPVAGIEPQHHLAQSDNVPFTVIFWLYVEHRCNAKWLAP